MSFGTDKLGIDTHTDRRADRHTGKGNAGAQNCSLVKTVVYDKSVIDLETKHSVVVAA